MISKSWQSIYSTTVPHVKLYNKDSYFLALLSCFHFSGNLDPYVSLFYFFLVLCLLFIVMVIHVSTLKFILGC